MAMSKDSRVNPQDSWEFVQEPWTTEDMAQSVQLLVKAHRHGRTEEVLKAVDIECRKLSECESRQDMNDSTKRLRDDPSSSGGYGQPARVGMSTYRMHAESIGPSPPMPMSSSPVTVVADENPLPPGVPSLEKWGQSLISFGKYAPKKVIYKELLDDVSTEVMSYKKYLFDHFETGSPGLRDLVSYMKASGFDYYRDYAGTRIPGSQHIRKFRS